MRATQAPTRRLLHLLQPAGGQRHEPPARADRVAGARGARAPQGQSRTGPTARATGRSRDRRLVRGTAQCPGAEPCGRATRYATPPDATSPTRPPARGWRSGPATRRGSSATCPPRRATSPAPPVLFVMSLVTTSLVFDLQEDNSLVRRFLDSGREVYLLDWGVPDAVDSQNSLETYCDEYLPRAVRAAPRRLGRRGGRSLLLLPRRRARPAQRRRPSRDAGAEHDPAGDAGRHGRARTSDRDAP